MRAYLLGEKLGHSYSPRIHALLGDYSYALKELPPDALNDFLQSGAFDALNVTIPYKRAVMPYCAELTETARAIGSVNTIVRRPDGTLLGDNTDAAGFACMLQNVESDPAGKTALVLGSGGASRTAQYVLRNMGARVVVISRSGENSYDAIRRFADAELLVNATPVGMYPDNGTCLVDLNDLPNLRAVFDLVYNPARTELLLRARKKGIPAIGGLSMLVEQARAASERFTGTRIPRVRSAEILRTLSAETQNIVLIGMPGCGKSSVGRTLARRMNREFVDADEVLEREVGMPIPDYFRSHSEAEFRDIESSILKELGKRSGIVLATGGGCVTRRENRSYLCGNGVILCLRRDLKLLPTDGRPVSQARSIDEIYREREPLYRVFADGQVINDGTIEQTVERAEDAFLRAVREHL